MIRNILFTDEVHFYPRWSQQYKELPFRDRDNPHGTVENNYQHLFAVNVWCVVTGEQLIGPYSLPQHLTGDN